MYKIIKIYKIYKKTFELPKMSYDFSCINIAITKNIHTLKRLYDYSNFQIAISKFFSQIRHNILINNIK